MVNLTIVYVSNGKEYGKINYILKDVFNREYKVKGNYMKNIL